jgi:ligand-binding sensor protein
MRRFKEMNIKINQNPRRYHRIYYCDRCGGKIAIRDKKLFIYYENDAIGEYVMQYICVKCILKLRDQGFRYSELFGGYVIH